MSDECVSRFQRHDLAFIERSAWADLLASRPDLNNEPLLSRWIERGHPLIVRRAVCGDINVQVPLGLPLPASAGKQRIAFGAPIDAITQFVSPPLLADAAKAVPESWRETIENLIAIEPQTRTFGSLAWQYLTGLAYMTAGSDLDLLWKHRDAVATEALLRAVEAVARLAPMRIDGEVIAQDFSAVHWRELLSQKEEVLAKRLDGARLIKLTAFMNKALP